MQAVRRGATQSAVPEEAASELAAHLLAPGVATAIFFTSVAHVRAITKDGAYGPLPGGPGTTGLRRYRPALERRLA